MLPPQRLTVNSNGVALQVYRWGDAARPAILLLHGWGDTGASFEHIAEPLAARYCVIAPDLRGFGESEWTPHGYWFPEYLADVNATADTLLAGQAFALVGHSMGGNIAGLYAGIRAERVSRLVLLEGFGLPATRPADAPGRYRRWLEDIDDGAALRDFDCFDALLAHLRRLAPRAVATTLAAVARQWAAPVAGGAWRLKMDPRHKCANPVLYRRDEAAACWRATTAGVLLICGGESNLAARFGDFDVVADVASHYADVARRVIPGAGHMLHWEQPEAVAAAIAAHLAVRR